MLKYIVSRFPFLIKDWSFLYDDYSFWKSHEIHILRQNTYFSSTCIKFWWDPFIITIATERGKISKKKYKFMKKRNMRWDELSTILDNPEQALIQYKMMYFKNDIYLCNPKPTTYAILPITSWSNTIQTLLWRVEDINKCGRVRRKSDFKQHHCSYKSKSTIILVFFNH